MLPGPALAPAARQRNTSLPHGQEIQNENYTVIRPQSLGVAPSVMPICKTTGDWKCEVIAVE